MNINIDKMIFIIDFLFPITNEHNTYDKPI